MQQERLSYASGPSTQPLLGMTIGEQFDQACRQYAEKEAIVSFHQNRRLTYKALQDEVNAFACSLLKLGLKKGDRLAFGHLTVWNGQLPNLQLLKQELF
ncbi:AMP-binding protein [Acinetobacter seifertii]|nr:AMP-binding protein [Acinetobacter seifertii]